MCMSSIRELMLYIARLKSIETVYNYYRGIDTNHQDFHGRAKFGVDFISSPALKGDPYGHGTHVAGM